MKTSSAKAKGRNLQKYVCSRILRLFSGLETSDCESRSMGSQGEDIMLSSAARRLLPVSFECKSHAKYAVYKDYAQCVANAKIYEPVLVIKQNHSHPLAVVDLDYFLDLLYEKSNKETQPNGSNTQVSSETKSTKPKKIKA